MRKLYDEVGSMRGKGLVFTVAVVVLGWAGASAAGPSSGAMVTLADVSHALEKSTLTITGWVENRGVTPASQLVIDAQGFSPSGDLAAFGSDGIPWELRPGATERFTIALTVTPQLIRDYVVQVSTMGPPSRLLASQRRSVSVELYRSLLFTRIGITGDLQAGVLTVRSSAEGLPVTQVTVRATVLLRGFDLIRREFEPAPVQVISVDLDLPADGTTVIPLGTRRAKLLSVRIVDFRLKSTWTD